MILRFAEVSAEQEDHLQKSRQNHDNEYHRGLVEERMQEIVDRQRLLYDEILEKRVRPESIPFHMKTLQSNKRLQSLLGEDVDLERQHSFTPRTRDCKTPASDGGGAASAAVTNTAVQSTGPLDRRLLRRASRRAKSIENPATTMKTNPWEERTVGIQDLLNVQEELWERVSGKSKGSRSISIFRSALEGKNQIKGFFGFSERSCTYACAYVLLPGLSLLLRSGRSTQFALVFLILFWIIIIILIVRMPSSCD